jgi:hypothetical protein
VIMAQAGGNFSAVTGLDLSLGPTLKEYHIDPEMTPFRYWINTARDLSSNNTLGIERDAADCFTGMTFQATGIHGQAFNLTGTDECLWAANDKDSFVNYHGSNRRRFAVEWATGNVTFANAALVLGNTGSSSSSDAAASSASSRSFSMGSVVAAATLGASLSLLMLG